MSMRTNEQDVSSERILGTLSLVDFVAVLIRGVTESLLNLTLVCTVTQAKRDALKAKVRLGA